MTDINKSLKEIQKLLGSIGLYTGAIDGFWGWGSYNAILTLSDLCKPNSKSSKIKSSDVKNISKEIQKILVEHHQYFGVIDGIFGKNSIAGLNNLIPAPKVTDESLKKIYKNCSPGFADFINSFAAQYQLNTKADLCAFLANNIHESSGFTSLRENMNYRPARLLEVFPKYFKTLAEATAVVKRGPIAIADVVYGGRMGNGRNNGDGYKYRGGGCNHLTGLDNYTLCSIGIGLGNQLIDNPDLITQPEYAVKSAYWFWNKNRCSRVANQGNFEAACRIVNGGTNGLSERHALHIKAWSVLF